MLVISSSPYMPPRETPASVGAVHWQLCLQVSLLSDRGVGAVRVSCASDVCRPKVGPS